MMDFMDQKSLREWELRCIQEEPPPCQATCPVHVDVRAMLAELAAGNFDAAAAIFSKSVPFPAVISYICEEPCAGDCNRRDVGDSIAIRALERAALAQGSNGGPSPKKQPARGKHVAVVGGGLSGLTAAFDLIRKGCEVTLYESASRLGGRLWDVPEGALPREAIHTDLAAIDALGVEVRLVTPIDAAGLDALVEAHDAVYLASGTLMGPLRTAVCNDAGDPCVNEITYETQRPGVFAGGSLMRAPGQWSPITSISDGRRATTSIDRYLQGASLTAARPPEGATPTNLFTSTAGIVPVAVVPAADPRAGYTTDEAIREAERCIQCECLECVKVCLYLEQYGGYPRAYARTIYNNLSIVMGERKANTFINSCALCGLCAEVCPADIDMGALCLQARQTMIAQDRMPPSTHEFALRDMAYSNGERFAMARNQPGTDSSSYVFFPGCQLAASYPAYIERIYADLVDGLPGKVGLMLGCCGAPAEWAGRLDLSASTMDGFREAHTALGNPALILACSSCQQMFRQHMPGVEIVSLWDVFDELELPATVPANRHDPVAVYDPCTARYEMHTQDSVRRIIKRLGYTIDELPFSREKTTCCSYGGHMWFADRELSDKVIERRIAESPADYVAYCAICRDFFASQGKPTLHLLDLIYGDDTDALARRRSPGYSERHENRARLKRRLLKQFWGEDVETSGSSNIIVELSDEVLARLEDRLILVEDIQQVLAYAERTGRSLLNTETGHYLTHYRPATVTYWVEYLPRGENRYMVLNAYSHRMDVVEDVKDE